MRRFALNRFDTMKTAAAAYGCCECPEVCRCSITTEHWLIGN